MVELSMMEIIKNTAKALIDSKVFVLVLLEVVLLIISLVFSRFMNKKLVYRVSIISSLILGAFYISNYISTLSVFINNVSTKLVEFIYFPTTLEYVIMLSTSIVIMLYSIFNKNVKNVIKYINTIIPISISFIFLTIIEFINTKNISFDEFSVFTDSSLMSLFEFGTSLFVVWIASLFVYKLDVIIINKLKNRSKIELPKLDDIEMPKLKIEA